MSANPSPAKTAAGASTAVVSVGSLVVRYGRDAKPTLEEISFSEIGRAHV